MEQLLRLLEDAAEPMSGNSKTVNYLSFLANIQSHSKQQLDVIKNLPSDNMAMAKELEQMESSVDRLQRSNIQKNTRHQ